MAAAATVGAALAAGCQTYKSPGNLATVPMKLGSAEYTVEIAATESTREHGLMQRDSMPDHWGMIFVFSDEEPRSFWMKNTRIPLDIVFIDAGGRVVSVHTMKPYDLSNTDSNGPAKYAVELNAGQADKCGIKAGDGVAIPAEAKDTRE